MADVQSKQLVSYDGVDLGLGPSEASDSSGQKVPAGFHRLTVERQIASGRESFDGAKAAIVDWAGHRKAGAILEPERTELAVGNVVALALRIWPLWVTASCRIVQVIDEPNRFGFTYGTLPHHPASGEERFLVALNPETDEVRLEIIAISKPASVLTRLAGPIARVMQHLTAGRYLDGFEAGTNAAGGFKDSVLRPGSLRWWLENRMTGKLTVAQFPNWPLFAIAGAAAVRWLSETGSTLSDGSAAVIAALWLYWGADELLRGVNPWRRLLGALVISWQLLRLLT